MKKQSLSKNPTTSGFTLLELLVVVFIIGILAAMGIPSWLSVINRQRVNTAQAQVVQALRSAQSTAKQTRSSQQVTFLNPPDQVPTIQITGKPDQKLGNGNLEQGMIQLELPTGTESITFDLDGNVDAARLPFRVVLAGTNNNPRRCVVVLTILGAMTQGADEECNP
ncbi:prepilin-type N-terminal cleavage/methylation domain-containing protein [Laspinema sp. D1]|uniref:Prepilin-type N-terminal cleavage/methylation domain-containing protein n=1 Tax=Laspinema palackyanum D2a TaxID=2953684 RepID=A0ABT2N2G7_9CYAN|nr:prepilin-type N-terminal cleavage/methylation domain-containing protein [Laspinema sp. D2a]